MMDSLRERITSINATLQDKQNECSVDGCKTGSNARTVITASYT